MIHRHHQMFSYVWFLTKIPTIQTKYFPLMKYCIEKGKKWKSCTSDYVAKFLMNPNQVEKLRVRHEDEKKGASYRIINIVAFGRTEEECLVKTAVEKWLGRGHRVPREKKLHGFAQYHSQSTDWKTEKEC